MKQTRKLIQETFVELALEKPVDKITVKEIVDTCGINRNSFYYHYEDLPDLIISIIEDMISDESRRHAGQGIQEVIISMARTQQNNLGLCRNVYYSKNREALSIRLNKTINNLIEDYLEKEQISRFQISEEDREIIIQTYRMEFAGMIREWMQDGMKYDLVHRFVRMLELREGTIDQMLLRAQESYLANNGRRR